MVVLRTINLEFGVKEVVERISGGHFTEDGRFGVIVSQFWRNCG